ncbi:hypothetical protein LINPERHAP1_LOCUS8304, partial [Linum perenne]
TKTAAPTPQPLFSLSHLWRRWGQRPPLIHAAVANITLCSFSALYWPEGTERKKASSHLRRWGRISGPTRSVGRRGDGRVSAAAGRRHAKEDGSGGEERGLGGDPARW